MSTSMSMSEYKDKSKDAHCENEREYRYTE
jgi:hypothetical protein